MKDEGGGTQNTAWAQGGERVVSQEERIRTIEERTKTIIEALNSQAVRLEECFNDHSRPERLKNLSLIAKGIILSASVIEELVADLNERASMAAGA